MKSAHLLLTASTILLAACDPCMVRVAQVNPETGLVRVHNDCPMAIEAETALCFGADGVYSDCTPLGELPPNACVDIEVDFEGKGMMAPKTAGIVAVFTGLEAEGTPHDAVSWGAKSAYPGVPVSAKTITAGSLTLGEEGWYPIPAGDTMASCMTWDHQITVQSKVCVPRLVEVHPGPSGSAFFKVALPAGCPEIELSNYHLAMGSPHLKTAIPMPAGVMEGGECFTVGGPGSDELNGWAQWGWDMLYPQNIGALGSGADHLTVMAAVLKGGEANNGIRWGGSPKTGLAPWTNLAAFEGAVTPGRSLRWTGETWEMAPSAGNQCPRWVIEK